jgi:hypothetical protein
MRAFVAPLVELELEVERIGEAATGLEVAVQETVRALERPLWWAAGLPARWFSGHPHRV